MDLANTCNVVSITIGNKLQDEVSANSAEMMGLNRPTRLLDVAIC